MGSNDQRNQVTYGLALASAVSQVGCVTVIVVVGALVAGLALDRWLDTRPLFTVLMLLGSMPVSIFLLLRIALSAAAQLQPPSPKAESPEDQPSDEE